MRMTIKDIAKEANVSIASVSRVINNKSEGVSKETRERILDIIEKYNYIPSSLARGLVTKKTNIIGLLLPDINNPFFPGIARGVEDAANKNGYNIILCNSDDNQEKERTYIRILKEKCVDGIIYTSALRASNENVGLLKEYNIPFISMDRVIDLENTPYICTNGEEGMYKILEHIIESGHKQIAYIAGIKGAPFNHSRLGGYKKALEKYNIPFNPKLVKYGDYKLEGGKASMEELLDSNTDITAVACENDIMAIGALHVLNNRKIKVPEEISITGYDNIFFTDLTYPKITTVSQPIYEMGFKAVELLMKLINKEDISDEKIILKPKIIIKDSVWRKGD